jgi:hypothetical protein
MKAAAIALFLAGLAHAADPATVGSYFLTVAQTKDASPEVIAIATDYASKLRRLYGSGLVFEARMRAIESPDRAAAIAAELDAQVKILESLRASLLTDSIRRVRETLGASRFAELRKAIDAWRDAPRPRARAQ